MTRETIAIAGASGYLGRVLVRHFVSRGYGVLPLTRGNVRTIEGVEAVSWNPEDAATLAGLIDGVAIVVNLCGKSVDCRYHSRNQTEILQSRLVPTRTIAAAIDLCERPPALWINASSATIYSQAFTQPQTEERGIIGSGFSVDVCSQWEKAFIEQPLPHTRRIALRTALVLGNGQNSVYPRLKRIARLGLGGAIGSGRQMVSWIHETDFARAVSFLVENEELDGVFNLAAPAPLPNKDFMRAIRERTGIPFGLPNPTWMLEIGCFLLRTESELVLKSRFIVPERLLRNRFLFRYPFVDEAMTAIDSETDISNSAFDSELLGAR